MSFRKTAVDVWAAMLGRAMAAVGAAMVALRECAEVAIEHLAVTDDAVYMQELYDALTQNADNFVRRSALVAWVEEFTPYHLVTVKTKELDKKGEPIVLKRFKKDKEKKDQAFHVAKAKAIPFWDFLPDPANITYTADSFLKAIMGTIKKFQENERYHPANGDAELLVIKTKNIITGLMGNTSVKSEKKAKGSKTTETKAEETNGASEGSDTVVETTAAAA